jgi:acetamidase/formamidase
MATAVGHRIGRDEIIWSFGPDLEPVLEVDPGEVVTFETNDCFTGQIASEDDLVTEIDLARVNSATGPVAVGSAEPGDSLVAEILDVRPVDHGFACLIPGFGQQIEHVESPVTRLVTELESSWIAHGTAAGYDEALQLCSEEAARLLVDQWGFSMEDAFIFLSVACDAGVAQACRPAPGFGTIARFSIPKLAATPGPFRP